MKDAPFDWMLLVASTFEDAEDVSDCGKPLVAIHVADPMAFRFIKFVAKTYFDKGAVLNYINVR